MAVISCPQCKKKISDKAKACRYCHLSLQALGSDQITHLAQINKINQIERLMNLSFIAIILFCSGFLFMYWENVKQGTWQHSLALASTVIGFLMYIIIRIKLLFVKRTK